MSADLTPERLGVTSACSAGSDFIKLYYEFLDKMRHKLSKLYLAEGVLIWNGNKVEGAEAIQKFYEEKLPSSSHTVKCFDSQPVHNKAVGDQSSIFVTTAGSVSFQGQKQDFHQTFLITSQGDKWKVASDCFRFQKFIQPASS